MKKGHRHGLDHSLARRAPEQHDRDPRRATRPSNRLAWWVGIDRGAFQRELRARYPEFAADADREWIAVHRITAADVAAVSLLVAKQPHRKYKKQANPLLGDRQPTRRPFFGRKSA